METKQDKQDVALKPEGHLTSAVTAIQQSRQANERELQLSQCRRTTQQRARTSAAEVVMDKVGTL